MKNGLIVLENAYYSVEIFDPAVQDKHFFTRYGYCGYIGQIFTKASGKKILGSPRKVFSPFSGEGFPDEFEKPLGYDEAEAGGEFLKIGVGREIKNDATPYTNHGMHEVSRRAEISVRSGADFADFVQKDDLFGFAYEYRKSVRLAEDKIRISHSLSNSGSREIDTLWYSHAFLPYGDAKEISFFIPERHEIPVNSEIYGGRCFNFDFRGKKNEQVVFADGKEIYRAFGDCEADELQVFINGLIVSAEPKIKIKLPVGARKSWSTEYAFQARE